VGSVARWWSAKTLTRSCGNPVRRAPNADIVNLINSSPINELLGVAFAVTAIFPKSSTPIISSLFPLSALFAVDQRD